MAYSTLAKVWSSERISKLIQSNVFSARSVVHLSILSRPGKAFPRERKWLCEYHNAWPSLGTLKYSSFWRWNSFQGHVTRHLDVAITLMMTMSSLSKILQSKNFSWEKLLTKSWNLQKKTTIKMLWTMHIPFQGEDQDSGSQIHFIVFPPIHNQQPPWHRSSRNR